MPHSRMRCLRMSDNVSFLFAVPPSPPRFTPVKLEHAEQLELGYMPLRDDFEKVTEILD